MVALADGGLRVREVECRSVPNKSGLADYAVNCYAGCEHGCVYCYARFVTRFSHPGEPWGSFVDVKINATQVLAHEAKRKSVGGVFISSVCDGWQPLEASYYLTRQCLEILVSRRYPLTILTKSALASPYIIVVEDDVDPFNRAQVLHALVTKCHPYRGIVRQERAFGSVLRPYSNQHERRYSLGARTYFDCTWPVDWDPSEVPERSSFEQIYPLEVQQKALAKWHKYGY